MGKGKPGGLSIATRSWTRRRFLTELARTGAAAPAFMTAGSVLTQRKPSPPQTFDAAVPTKSVLTGSDFTYRGAFRVPSGVNGHDAAWGRCLAIRYVDGKRKFLSMTVSQALYEMDDPGLTEGDPNSAPMANVTRFWGRNAFMARHTVQYGSPSGFVYGLYWDDTDERLYFNYGDTYKANANPDSSIGYATLDDSTGVATSVGSWQVGHNSKMTMGGVLPIPDWFAQQFTRGRRLGAGFGGYQSIVATGPASMGPALFAFSPPDPSKQKLHSMVPSTPLVAYPFNGTPYSQPDRCHRDTDYRTEFDKWNPRNGVGYFTWVDIIWQGGVWIDLPTKHGVIFFPILGNGRVWYQASTGHAERGSHWWYIYDPTTLALVARGSKKSYEIQPSQQWPVQYPSRAFSYPLAGWQDEPTFLITGSSYDSSAQQLFVAVRFAYGGPGLTPRNGTVVYAYGLNP
jgi:hypothetical protein